MFPFGRKGTVAYIPVGTGVLDGPYNNQAGTVVGTRAPALGIFGPPMATPYKMHENSPRRGLFSYVRTRRRMSSVMAKTAKVAAAHARMAWGVHRSEGFQLKPQLT